MGVPAAVPLGSPEPLLSHCHWAVRRVNRRRPKWNTERRPSPLCKPHALHTMSCNVLLPRWSRGHDSPGRAGGEVQSTQSTSSAEGPTRAGVGAWPGLPAALGSLAAARSDSPDGQCGLRSSREPLLQRLPPELFPWADRCLGNRPLPLNEDSQRLPFRTPLQCQEPGSVQGDPADGVAVPCRQLWLPPRAQQPSGAGPGLPGQRPPGPREKTVACESKQLFS